MQEYSLKVNNQVNHVLAKSEDEAKARLVDIEKCKPDEITLVDIRDVEVYRRA